MCKLDLTKHIRLKRNANKLDYTEEDVKRYNELCEQVKRNKQEKKIEIKSVKPKICSDSSLVIKNGSA